MRIEVDPHLLRRASKGAASNLKPKEGKALVAHEDVQDAARAALKSHDSANAGR